MIKLSMSTQCGLTFTIVSLLQLCRTALKALTGTRGTKSYTVKISCDMYKIEFCNQCSERFRLLKAFQVFLLMTAAVVCVAG